MSPYRVYLSMVLCIVLIIGACKQEPSRSFYYWKTVYHLSKPESRYMDELHISKLYMRFFDVDWDNESGQVVPLAKISFSEKIPAKYEVVPVVYIVNRSIINLDSQYMATLAYKILKQVDNIAALNDIRFKEVQIDCDWNNATREKYFTLLNLMKKQLHERNNILSATIRLHQVKYRYITGLPPVDRGMLMYYNMGKITPGSSPNSVFNTRDAAKYIDYLPDYPLPLDAALPAFSWAIHIRNYKVIELLSQLGTTDFKKNIHFSRVDSSRFRVLKSFFFHGYYFMKDDIVKVEEITPAQCYIASRQLDSKLAKPATCVAIFHLDSVIISHYDKKDFEKVFDTYR